MVFFKGHRIHGFLIILLHVTKYFLSHLVITCGSLTVISNGRLTYTPDTTVPFDYGTNATFSCDSGYFLEGDVVRTCIGDGSDANGNWNGMTPQCTGILYAL